MTDYFKNVNQQDNSDNKFYKSLIDAAEQFSDRYSSDYKLTAYVGTDESSWEDSINIRLTLMTMDSRNPYFYNLVTVRQVIGDSTKATVFAFVNPPTETIEINADEFDDYLIKEVFGDVRFKVVIQMISQMGETIKTWED